MKVCRGLGQFGKVVPPGFSK
ncbi:hypothetical protein BN381_640010 [Candidatus Microthrix parvicella RN1]|uniref:Uncharacterized protein n=1 Tax=Candidatus Neomicrothrix parvicella RN1 TaxID=1229780 RepID=R4Z3H1_9ACTN|nr:hypothetical protein BN381_640010 [Candidatus Microthrix parvicella RN1]